MRTIKHILNIIILLTFSIVVYSQNIDTLQKQLLSRLEAGDSDKISMDIAKELFEKNLDVNPEKSTQYAGIYLQIAQHQKDSILIGRGKKMLGESYLSSGNYFMASTLLFEAYSIFSRKHQYSDKAQTLLIWSKVYIEQENYEISRLKIKQAIEIYRQIGDSAGVFNAKVTYGRTFLNNNDYQAIEQFSYAFNIATEEILNKYPEIYEYAAIANYNTGKTKIALDYLIKAKSIFKEKNDLFNLAKTYEIFGDIFYNEENYKNAIKNYKKAKEIFSKIKLKRNLNYTELKISKIYFKLNDLKTCEQNVLQIIQYAKMFNDFKLLKDSYALLLEIYKSQNDKDKIIYYSQLYIDAINNYYSDLDMKNFSSFQMNLEINNFDKELELLKVKNEKQNLQLAQKQYKRNKIYAIIISLIGLLFIIFLYFRYRERKKVAYSLQKANIELQQEIEYRKKLEAEAQENEKRYKLLFDQSPIGILNFNENLYITDVNDRFLEIFLAKRQDIVGQHINRIFDRKTTNSVLELFNNKDKSQLKTESEIPTKNDVVYLSVTVKKYKLVSTEGDYSGGIMILEDLTEHKKAERFYKSKLLTKQKLIEKNPDNLILIDQNETILAMHFTQSPEIELKANKLQDIFSEQSTYQLFKTHLSKIKDQTEYTQFFVKDKNKNLLVRMFRYPDSYLIIISKLQKDLSDVQTQIAQQELIDNNNSDYISDIKDDIQKELLPIYQNIQRGLSFLMIKNFAEKIIDLGQKHNNNKIIDFGKELLDALSSFNVIKVNNIIESFPSFISQFMHFSI